MSLEQLEKELYGQKNPKRSNSLIKENKSEKDFSDAKTPNPWSGDFYKDENSTDYNYKPSKYGKIGKILIISLSLITIILLGFVGFYLYQYFNTKGANIEVSFPDNVLIGEPFKVSVLFENVSDKNLVSPKLSLTLPDDVFYTDDNSKRTISKDLGEMSPGEYVKEEYELIMVGEPFKAYQFSALASYTYESSALSNRFEKQNIFQILAKESILSLDFSGPEKVLNGEDFEMSLRYKNNSNTPISNVSIKIEAPKEFKLNGSDPVLDNMSLNFESLLPSKEGVVMLSGNMKGNDYSFFSLKSIAQIKFNSKDYKLVSKDISVSILPSLLSLNISPSVSSKVIYPGDPIRYDIDFTNNTQISLNDVILRVNLLSGLFDLTSVKSSGYFDSLNNIIIWTASDIPELKELKPGQKGGTYFEISLKKDYPATKISDKNFVVKISGQISSPTVPQNVIAQKTIGFAENQINVGGKIDFKNYAYFKEPSSDIVNKGKLPPKAGAPTQYTIHWKLGTIGSDFRDIKMIASLGPGVKWTGKVKSNIESIPIYNERTQEISWEIPLITANKGNIEKEPEATFQIEITPSTNQIGSRLNLVSGVKFFALEAFNNIKIERGGFNETDSSSLLDLGLPQSYDIVIK